MVPRTGRQRLVLSFEHGQAQNQIPETPADSHRLRPPSSSSWRTTSKALSESRWRTSAPDRCPGNRSDSEPGRIYAGLERMLHEPIVLVANDYCATVAGAAL